MNNFLAIKEFCAKFTGINFLGRTNVKYLMQTQLLRFCKNTAKVSSLPLLKITTKSTHFLLAKKKIPIPWIELKINIKYKRSQNLTSKHRAVKNLQIAKTFSKNVDKKAIQFLSYFLLHSSFLSIYLHKKSTFPLRIYLVNVNISA